MRARRRCSRLRSARRASRSCSTRRPRAIEGSGRVERVVLKDGRAYPAALVVMAVGVRPATALAEIGRPRASAAASRSTMRSRPAPPGIYAIGECAEHRGTCCGLVEPAYEQAKVLARHLAGLPARYEGSVTAASLKVSGVPVFSMGDFDGRGRRGDPARGPGRRRLPQARHPRRPTGRRGAVRRYRRRALVPRPDPPAGLDRADPRRARLRQGLRGGRLMSAQDFTEEQRRYLEGFVSGVQARRAAQGLKPLGAEGGGAAQPAGPDKEHLAAMARFEAAGRKLSPEEKAKRDEHPFDAYAPPQGTRAPRASSPRASTISAGASTGSSIWRRRTTPTCAGCASPTASSRTGSSPASPIWPQAHGGGYAHVTTRANLQIRDVMPHGAIPLIEGLASLGITHQGDGCRQHPQRHRLAHRRHRPPGADRHPSLRASLAPSHPQRPLALRPAAQVQRRLRRRRRHPRARGHQRHRLHGREGERGAPVSMRACGSAWESAASPATRTSPSTAASTCSPDEAVAVADAIVRVFIDNGDRTDRKKARLKYVLDAWGLDKFLAEVEAKLGRQAGAPGRRPGVRAQPAGPPGAHRLSCPEAARARLGRRRAARRASMTAEQMRGPRQHRPRARRRRYPPHRLAEPADLRHRRGERGLVENCLQARSG